MYEPYTSQLERSSALAGLAPQTEGLGAATDRRGSRGQRGGRQSVDETGPRSRPRSTPAAASTRGPAPAIARPTRPSARAIGARSRGLWLPRRALDPHAGGRRHPPRIWGLLSPASCGPFARRDALEPAKARPPRPPAQRCGDRPLARGNLARHQKGQRPSSRRSSL
jgi:hypothetical protein